MGARDPRHDYEGIFHWDGIDDTSDPAEQMRQAAVATRLVHLLHRGIKDVESDIGTSAHDQGILLAALGYLDCITSRFLPRAESEDDAQTAPPAPEGPRPGLRVVESAEEGA
jgi:hypothetical protein